MDYNFLKALHIIFIVTWFAGLFYVVRLFVYYAEAQNKEKLEKDILSKQYQLMIYRLWYIITWPSAVLASVFAFWMLFFTPVGNGWLMYSWMHVKLAFVLLLYIYHLYCHKIFLEIQNNSCNRTSNFFRIWNEGATIILFAVVFLVVLKDAINWIFGVVGIIVFSILIMLGFKLYKKIREKN